MHPILVTRSRLGLYLAAWIPLVSLLATLLAAAGSMPAGQATALSLLLTATYAFVCLGIWYVCRALPLSGARIAKALGTHAAGAVLSSALWLGSGRAWAVLLGQLFDFEGIEERYLGQTPVLFAIGALLYLLAAAVYYLATALVESRAAERRALELRALAREAELRALRAQIDPHFLFNSLNSVNALIAADPQAARATCLRLSEFLRATLQLGARERVPLADEVALVESYLAVEQVRLGPRLRVEKQVEDGARRCLVPPLLLQPLVENAVRHGVAQLVEGGVIRVEAARRGATLALAVENPCDPERRRAQPAGVGLENVRARLLALSGPAARLETGERDGRFRADISLPAPTGEPETRA